ncbi:MAG: hypothetical protein MHM6MM_004876 [Cercozoa sp. M6MM]
MMNTPGFGALPSDHQDTMEFSELPSSFSAVGDIGEHDMMSMSPMFGPKRRKTLGGHVHTQLPLDAPDHHRHHHDSHDEFHHRHDEHHQHAHEQHSEHQQQQQYHQIEHHQHQQYQREHDHNSPHMHPEASMHTVSEQHPQQPHETQESESQPDSGGVPLDGPGVAVESSHNDDNDNDDDDDNNDDDDDEFVVPKQVEEAARAEALARMEERAREKEHTEEMPHGPLCGAFRIVTRLSQTTFHNDQIPLTLGRDHSARRQDRHFHAIVQSGDKSVSRSHLEIDWSQQRGYTLVCWSKNGMEVDGADYVPSQESREDDDPPCVRLPLADLTRVRIGRDTVFYFQLPRGHCDEELQMRTEQSLRQLRAIKKRIRYS